MDKANLSTPSVLAQLPVFGTPPRRDRPRGGPAPHQRWDAGACGQGGPVTGQVRCRARHSTPTTPGRAPGLARCGPVSARWPPSICWPCGWGWFECWFDLATLAGAWLAPLRCAELRHGVSTRWRSRLRNQAAQPLKQVGICLGLCAFERRNLEKCRRNPVEVLEFESHLWACPLPGRQLVLDAQEPTGSPSDRQAV